MKHPHQLTTPENYAPCPAKLEECKRGMEAAGVRHCFSLYVDIHGVPKAKTNPLSAFEKMAAGSELFTVGAMDGMGLVGPHEDECAAVPDLDTLTLAPWDHTKAFFFGELYYHGQPYANDTRAMLKRQMERAAAMGYVPQLGLEPEFYVLRPATPEGEYPGLQPHRFRSVCPAYDVHQTLGAFEFLDPMSRDLEELGWGLFSFDQEGGHSQFEFDCHYANALTMADRFVFLRLMARQVAERLGLIATFMPKPFADDFRSGCHCNFSLASMETGKNLFEPEPEGNAFIAKYGAPLSKIGYHFAAGVLAHAPAIVAATCPTYNSYQGLIAQGDMPDVSWAPVLMTWGRNNRSAMLRVPINRSCVENRAPDMSMNPYLAAALQIAAGLDGIEQQLDPGGPLNENCYQLTREELAERGIHRLPHTLLEALEAFASDPWVETVTGAEFRRIFLRWKQREWEEGFYKINPDHRTHRLTFL